MASHLTPQKDLHWADLMAQSLEQCWAATEGNTECETVGTLLGIELGTVEGVWLDLIEGTSECITVGASLGT